MSEPQEFLIGIPGVGIFRLYCVHCGIEIVGFKLSEDKRSLICEKCGKKAPVEKDDVLTAWSFGSTPTSTTLQ